MSEITEWYFQASWKLWLFIFLGAGIIWVIVLRPKKFWPILIVGSIGTGGLLIQGYGIVDEFLLTALLLGGFIATSLRDAKIEVRSFSSFHQFVFLTFMLYLSFQSIRGAFVLGDWRVLRFSIFFTSLASLMLFRCSAIFPLPPPQKTVKLIAWSSLIYLAAYVGNGLYSEIIRGVSRFENQGIDWGGSVYSLFPLVVAIPTAILLLKEHIWTKKLLGIIILCTAAIAGGYYDSRISLVALTTFLPVSWNFIGLRKWVLLVLTVVFFLSVGSWSLGYRGLEFVLGFGGFTREGYLQSTGVVTPLHDIDRLLALAGALHARGG